MQNNWIRGIANNKAAVSYTHLDVYKRQRLDFRKLFNTVLNDIFICFLIMLVGAYLKSTIVIEFIKLFNLMWFSCNFSTT